MAAAPKAIVVRAPNWLGDTVMALPALRALRAARPEALITVVGRWAGLLLGQAVADLALPYPRPLRRRLSVNRRLGAARPDLALVLPNSMESALGALLWRAPRRVGFDAGGRRRLLTDAPPLPAPRLHQIDEYALLLGGLGIEVVDRTPCWKVSPMGAAETEVAASLAEAGLDGTVPLVGLHLGAAFGSSKLWQVESLGRLGARLRQAGLAPVLLGSADDLETEAAVTRAAGGPLPSLVGRDRPALLPPVLGRLSCLLSGDTGVAHLAASLGVPTVTLFGPTDPRLTAPRGPKARALWREVPCAPCFLPSCPIDHVCLRGISVEEVEREVRSLVNS